MLHESILYQLIINIKINIFNNWTCQHLGYFALTYPHFIYAFPSEFSHRLPLLLIFLSCFKQIFP